MVVADPAAELVDLVRSLGDPDPAAPAALVVPPAAARAAALVRRRFGLALPPPFCGPVEPGAPIRAASAVDGAAIASIKWRAFGANYRGGVLPDAFLDQREVVPPPSFWAGRAMVPPSRRHRLLVWGRPGTAYAYADCGPVHPDDAAPGAPEAGEVYELYVDPAAQGLGGGGRLLDAAEAWLAEAGFGRRELSVIATNPVARAFYEARGWWPTGAVAHVDLGVLVYDEVRLASGAGVDWP